LSFLKGEVCNLNKNMLLLTTIIIFLLFFSGCTEQKIIPSDTLEETKNIPAKIVMNSPEKGYFDETIRFDASESYDPDGRITSFYWDFMDDSKEGETVNHIFKINDNYDIEYPVIYTVTLQVTDNNSTITTYTHEIALYPKNYLFYLTSGKLVYENPVFSKETIKSNNLLNLKDEKYLLYQLEKPIKITKSVCNITLFLEKNILSKINEIKIELIDDKDNALKIFEEKTSLNLWTNKKIQIREEINQEIHLKSIKVSTYSFSLLNQIDILYGAETSSIILFEFEY
jgi:hypothetical protein